MQVFTLWQLQPSCDVNLRLITTAVQPHPQVTTTKSVAGHVIMSPQREVSEE